MGIMATTSSPLPDEVTRRKLRLPNPEISEGRGIVTAIGGARIFTCGYVLIRLLREELNCKLPIEVWHYGEAEITPVMRHLLAPYDVTFVDARAFLAGCDVEIQDGWQLKAFSMLYSSFSELLFLDADQVPVENPDKVFEFGQFKDTGAVFWPDIMDLKKKNPIWSQLGLEARSLPSFESGQVLIDRDRHLSVLKTIVALNEMKEEIYGSIYGDKDTFLVGFMLENETFSLVPHRPFVTERVLVQRDFDGAALFQHRTNAKWLYSGRQVRFEGECHAEVCDHYLEELKRKWNGGLFEPPDRTMAARTEEAMLEGRGIRRLEFVGDRNESIELLEAHELGQGRSLDRKNWYVLEKDGSLDLIVEADGQIFYQLKSCDDGTWRGLQSSQPSAAVILHAAEQSTGSPRLPGDGLVESLVAASGIAHAGETPREDLETTLTLLLRAEPGVRSAIESQATRSAMLDTVVQRVLKAVPEPESRAPDKNGDTLGKGYVDWRRAKM